MTNIAAELEARHQELHGSAPCIPSVFRRATAELRKLAAENDRLRDALERISDFVDECDWDRAIGHIQDMAEAALTPVEGEPS